MSCKNKLLYDPAYSADAAVLLTRLPRTSIRIVAERGAGLQRGDLLLQLRICWMAPLAAAALRPRCADGRHQTHSGRQQP